MVGTANASTNNPADAAIVLVKGTNKALAVKVDCNSRYVHADPYKGAMIAVAEAARNIVCSGGKPLGVTNCLNFGNPYDPEVYYQFVNAVKGMGEACRKFGTPVTGGNVSFYNQNPDGPVFPTPTIGMVGLVEDIRNRMTMDFKKEGDLIYVLGSLFDDINCSEYLHKIVGIEYSPAPPFDLDQEYELQKKLLQLIDKQLITSAHDISEGGLFVALCESAFVREKGFNLTTSVISEERKIRPDAFLFGESQGRVVVSVEPDKQKLFESNLHTFPYLYIGAVTSGELIIGEQDFRTIQLWKELYETAIEKHLAGELTSEAALSMI
jgi:phosphoribosylformylglycinamidine synthase